LVAQKTGSDAEEHDFCLFDAQSSRTCWIDSSSSIQKEIAQAKLLKDL